MSSTAQRLGAALLLTAAAAFPAAAQQVTIKAETQGGGAGLALRAEAGKQLRGTMNVNCDSAFVSFYRAGSPTAIKVQGDKAHEVTLDNASPIVEQTPIPMPADLNPANLCVAGRPDATKARQVFTERLAR